MSERIILRVYWTPPPVPPPDGSVAISFLFPTDEEALAAGFVGTIHRGREVAQQLRPKARRIYHELIARIGIIELEPGLTLRSAMNRPGESSAWWYHHVAFRDSESGEQFNWIIQVLTIQFIADSIGATHLSLRGAPSEVAAVLSASYEIVKNDSKIARASLVAIWARGVGSRLRYLRNILRHKRALQRHYTAPTCRFDVVLSSFWDWGFKIDAKNGEIIDRYFRRLPGLLDAGSIKFGYFAWFDPHYEPVQQGRPLPVVLAPLEGQDKVILLQTYLGSYDVVRELLDFSSYRAITQLLNRPETQKAFNLEGLGWQPLFESELKRGSVNAHIANCRLIALATARAAARHSPRISIGFLEHFPHARAHYEGMRRSGLGAHNYTMQHAGCARDKTFYFLHPQLELAGEPDACRVPQPDQIFAMGTLGADVFGKCGYRKDQILLYGSARYDHIVPNLAAPVLIESTSSKGRSEFHVLIACSLEVTSEIAMVEAVCLAAAGLPGVILRLRNHPSSRVDIHPRFAAFRGQLEVSSSLLETDIAWTDLVLYSYSTVAEEAYIQGKPAWQWLPLGFNGSALADAVKVPQFGSVRNLRSALEDYITHPENYAPSRENRAEAAEKLFAPADGKAADRIAAECVSYLARKASGSAAAKSPPYTEYN